ncbi:MAG: hypothetical protein WCA08_13620 [Desulfoferrobacter sp.]
MQPVVTTPGTFLSQKDACFRLKQQGRKIAILPLEVESTIISNQVIISDQAVVPTLEQNIKTPIKTRCMVNDSTKTDNTKSYS